MMIEIPFHLFPAVVEEILKTVNSVEPDERKIFIIAELKGLHIILINREKVYPGFHVSFHIS